MANQYRKSSNGAIVNDPEQPQTHISRSRHYLTLNISETVRDIDIQRTYAILKNVISNDFE